ncbi:MAG: Smr/MutS family protein [Rikenellaceae bacterium]|nr:Smr/MutS family protein [Rikenellaceae bacterium]
MNERLEQKLGFDRIRSMTESRCSTSLAKGRAGSELFSTSYDEIEEELSRTDEMRLIIMFESSFPDTGFVDIYPFLKHLEASSSFLDLNSVVRLRNSLDTTRQIIAFFKNTKEGQYGRLKKMSEPVIIYPEISRRIDSIVDKFGEMKDSASVDLQTIRRAIKDKENQISRRINSILKSAQSEGLVDEDASVSVRDGRVLIPVLAANKRKIQGFIYDESASGKTAFVEPLEIVELNNLVRELHFAEQREIVKILVEFSDFLRPYLPELLQSAIFMAEIDFLRAKALLSIQMQAGKPIISKEQILVMNKGRHPLLESALKKDGKEIVPLSLSLERDKHILLISGPNAGGKSVCLKTVGLLQYMFQCGFLIPASEISELGVFNNIFIDIGDEQSIENDLSTYSSHLKNMRDIIQQADSHSLVLIDEFGAGTEPTAGGAIAEAILTEIERKGAFGVITTHYSNLKFYASSSNGVLNGGMQFDVQNIKPLFKLEIGTPGSSFAFELARKMGLPEQVVKLAEEKAGSDFVDLERHLRKIARNRRQWEEKLAKIKSTDKTLENITDKYQKELTDIQSLKKSIIEGAKKEAASIITEANKKIEQTIKEIKETQAEKEHTKLLRKELSEFSNEVQSEKQSAEDEKIAKKMEQLLKRKERNEERKVKREEGRVKNGEGSEKWKGESEKGRVKSEESGELKAGDKVRIDQGEVVGEIIKIEGRDVSVAIGSIISRVPAKRLTRISGKDAKGSAGIRTKSSIVQSESISERKLNFKPTIDVRGQRLEEAIESVTRFIDDAIMVDVSEVKILHGKGNGILREELRKYLKAMGVVQSAKDEDIQLGGAGITVVKLI